MNFESDQEEIFDELADQIDLTFELAESVVEEKIGFIEIIALPDDPKVFGLHPFASIREIVENQAH